MTAPKLLRKALVQDIHDYLFWISENASSKLPRSEAMSCASPYIPTISKNMAGLCTRSTPRCGEDYKCLENADARMAEKATT